MKEKIWASDASGFATCAYSIKGEHLYVFRIMVFCQRLNIKIITILVLRDDPRIQTADDGSKTTDTDD
jgi:hypothetical protein